MNPRGSERFISNDSYQSKKRENMPRDPFDEFREIEKMFEKMMEGEGITGSSTSRRISIHTTEDGTKIEVHGDVPEEQVEKLREQYPDADITSDAEGAESPSPVRVVDEEEEAETSPEDKEKEMEPEELALRRLEEKKRKSDRD